MYIPPAFAENRLEVMHALMRDHPLGLLVVNGPDGLDATPVPFVLDAGTGPRGVLRAHLARPNPMLAALATAGECMVMFQGPQAYVTPSWYPAKAETGKVVPTWNYAVVQAWGAPRIMDDAAWLHRQIRELTDRQEFPREQPWAVDDAPADYLASMVQGIVGVEIPIARLAGKWKASQNRNAADRAGVARGLEESEDSSARAMADLVRRGGA